MVYGLIACLGLGLVLLVIAGEKRHARVMRRLRRFEKTESDLLRLRRSVYADRAAASAAKAGRESTLPVLFTSQFGEDLFLWDLFGGKLDGFFIEVGGHDGFTDSVTYPFEAAGAGGWKGVLVEPLPERYAACRELRKHSHVVHAALSKRGASGTTTLTVLDAGEGADPIAHIAERPIEGVYTKHFSSAGREVSAPLTFMDAVLESAVAPSSPAEIDFAVLDVEGFEPELLDGFDLRRWRPRALVVEDLSMGEKRPAAGKDLRAIIESQGYVQVMWLAYNRVFVRSDEPGLIARAKELAERVPIPSRGGR